MNENEYRAQRAVGTIDFRQAAVETKSKKVLARIVEDTQDSDARAAVALNPKTDVRTLTRIIVDRDTEDYIIDLCIWHPTVVEHVLKTWSEKDYMNTRPALKSRLYGIQASNGIREEDRISLEIDPDKIDWAKFTKKMMFPSSSPSQLPYKTTVIGKSYPQWTGKISSNTVYGSTTYSSTIDDVDGQINPDFHYAVPPPGFSKISLAAGQKALGMKIDPDISYYTYGVDEAGDVPDVTAIQQMMNGAVMYESVTEDNVTEKDDA